MTTKRSIAYYSIIGLGVLVAILAIIYGAYLPLAKSEAYINALQSANSVHTLQEFKDVFNRVLQFQSPVGDEETAKFLGNVILGIVSQSGQSEDVSRALAEFVRPYFADQNVIHLLTAGNIYDTLWRKFHKEEDFAVAEAYYLRALELGPKVPPTLFGLLDLYRSKGGAELEKVQSLATTILKYWPDAFGVAQVQKP